MEEIKIGVETIYLELLYIKFEWTLMKKMDESLIKDEASFNKIKTISFFFFFSLWYAIIMRIAKIWDNTKKTGSLLKILNKIETCPDMKDLREKISIQEISKIKTNINNVMEDINTEGEINNLFIESRHKYFAHLGNLNSPKEVQKLYLIGKNRVDSVVTILFEVVERLCKELHIVIAKEDFKHKLNILSNVEYPYLIKSITIKGV